MVGACIACPVVVCGARFVAGIFREGGTVLHLGNVRQQKRFQLIPEPRL